MHKQCKIYTDFLCEGKALWKDSLAIKMLKISTPSHSVLCLDQCHLVYDFPVLWEEREVKVRE